MVPSLPLLFACPLSARARDREVGAPADAQRLLDREVGGLVGEDGRVGDLLDQAGAEQRRGDAENHVLVAHLRREVLLGKAATGRVGTARDGEERMDASVSGAVRVLHEARLAHRPVGAHERRQRVVGAELASERDLRIQRGAGAADGGLRVAAAARVEVHGRAEAVRGYLHVLEVGLARGEERELLRGEARERTARSGRAAAHAGVARALLRNALGIGLLRKQQRSADRGSDRNGTGHLAHGASP